MRKSLMVTGIAAIAALALAGCERQGTSSATSHAGAAARGDGHGSTGHVVGGGGAGSGHGWAH